MNEIEKKLANDAKLKSNFRKIISEKLDPYIDAKTFDYEQVTNALFHVSCADAFTNHLRDELRRILDVMQKHNATRPEVVTVLLDWIKTIRIETLAEWLGRVTTDIVQPQPTPGVVTIKTIYEEKNWKLVDREKLKTRLEAVTADSIDLPAKEPTGPNDKVYPRELHNDGPETIKRWMFAHEWPALWVCFFKNNQEKNWLAVLAAPWLEDEAAKKAADIKRAANSVGLNIRALAVTENGHKWTRMPRALDLTLAALGGPFDVTVNGENYAEEPAMAGDLVGRALRPREWRLRPRGVDVVPAEWLGPEQIELCLNCNSDEVKEYLIETAAKTASLAMPHMCAKLLGFMFAATAGNRQVGGTLLTLGQHMYPPWATGKGPTVKPWKERRQNKRDLEGLGQALVADGNLRLKILGPDGVRMVYRMFSLVYSLSAKPDAPFSFQLDPYLAAMMYGGNKWTGENGGFFLINMTRWLTLEIKNPRLFPLALRVAAMWDRARVNGIYDPARLQPIEADRLAAQCNTLSPGALLAAAGKTDAGAARVALSYARAKLESDMDDLKEAGMMGDWKRYKRHGLGGVNVLPDPPDDYAEACRRAVEAVKKGKRDKG